MQRKDLLRKIIDFNFFYSQVCECFLRAWDSLSPGEFSRLYRIVRPYTMVGNARLRGLYNAVKHAIEQDVPGDLMECGTARGGSAALMGLTLKALGWNRTLWACDTFEGLPPPTIDDPDEEIADEYTGLCRGDFEEVQRLFNQLGILENCKLVKGLFQDTLPLIDIEHIAVLHLDGDWYESTKVCLEYLYDKVSPYGIIQFDDYGHWDGCRKAVDEFLKKRSLHVSLVSLDYTGVQLIKLPT